MQLWSKAFPNPRFYGWAIVGACFACSVLSTPGQSVALALYLDHLIDDLGVSRLELSSLYGAMTLLAAFCLPFVGSLADRVTGKNYLTIALASLGIACLAFSQVTGLIGVAAGFFALRLIGQGSIGLGTLTIIVRWFKRYRSRALAVANLGFAGGEMIFPALILALIGIFGWRGSMISFGLVYLFVFAPLCYLVVRQRNDDEAMDGETDAALDPAGDKTPALGPAAAVAAIEPAEVNYSLGEVMRMPGFWLLAAVVSVLPMVATAVIFHQVALFKSLGWSIVHIPMAFAAFAIAKVIATYAVGILLERYPCNYGLAAGMFVATLSMLVMLVPITAPWLSLVYGALLGVSAGILTSSNAIVWPEYYGIAALGAIKGVITSIRNGATAVGPPLAAYLAGPEENFTSTLIVLAALCAISAALAIFARAPEA